MNGPPDVERRGPRQDAAPTDTITAASVQPCYPRGGDPVVRWRLERGRYRRRISDALDLVCIRLYGADAAARYGIVDRWGYDNPQRCEWCGRWAA